MISIMDTTSRELRSINERLEVGTVFHICVTAFRSNVLQNLSGATWPVQCLPNHGNVLFTFSTVKAKDAQGKEIPVNDADSDGTVKP
ncbi:hypothetical protein LshimejAT787_1400150 [Lyophyllum shimeji]|uniref:Uncharacterized protein n=1 Tax=Lyophyllum shimeji TaxID=47721 RepID=A0A9P3PXR1_LYOSH|nr:hypothetical protein LshimejAT787_1400150 [Lyophyllum shimeji]